MKSETGHIARKLVERWLWRPDFFIQDVIFSNAPKEDKPSSQQLDGAREVGKVAEAKWLAAKARKEGKDPAEVLDPGVLKYSRKRGISIRSGQGCGKDAFLSWIYFWLLFCFGTERTTGLVTAMNQSQLRSILWSEFRYWMKYTQENAGGESILSEIIAIESEIVYVKGAKGTTFVEGRTANIKTSDENEQAEALAGKHAEYMILAADEASGLPRGVFKPVEGAMTGAVNFAILIGNPTRSSGYFYDTFHSDSNRWVTLHWNAEESPIVNQDELRADNEKWGRESNWYRIRRRGEFALAEPDALIPIELIHAAVDRELEEDENMPGIYGVDVGLSRDPSVICHRRGGVVKNFYVREKLKDTYLVAEWVSMHWEEDHPTKACVDAIGVGHGVISALRNQFGRRVVSVSVNGVATDPERFGNLRAELNWKLREMFYEGTISIPDDPELCAELSILKINADKETNKIFLVSKKKQRSELEGHSSPNKADALAYSFRVQDVAYKSAIAKYAEESERGSEKPDSKLGWMSV